MEEQNGKWVVVGDTPISFGEINIEMKSRALNLVVKSANHLIQFVAKRVLKIICKEIVEEANGKLQTINQDL